MPFSDIYIHHCSDLTQTAPRAASIIMSFLATAIRGSVGSTNSTHRLVGSKKGVRITFRSEHAAAHADSHEREGSRFLDQGNEPINGDARLARNLSHAQERCHGSSACSSESPSGDPSKRCFMTPTSASTLSRAASSFACSTSAGEASYNRRSHAGGKASHRHSAGSI